MHLLLALMYIRNTRITVYGMVRTYVRGSGLAMRACYLPRIGTVRYGIGTSTSYAYARITAIIIWRESDAALDATGIPLPYKASRVLP